MRRTVLALLAALALVSFATPALADAPLADGVLCYLASVADPTAPGTQTGVLGGGPVTMTDQDGLTLESGTLTCRVQTDIQTHAGYGPSNSGHGTAVIAALPVLVSYPQGSDVYLCAEFNDDSNGATYYWDADNAKWSANVNSACGLAYGSDTRWPEETLIDSILCPVFALVFPPTGDITLRAPIGDVWDCPPYGDNHPRRPVRVAYAVVAQ